MSPRNKGLLTYLNVFFSLCLDHPSIIILPFRHETRGGVLIAWKGCACQAIAARVDTYSVSVLFSEQEGCNWWFTRVYGPQGDDEKDLFLQELRDIRTLCNGPSLVAGDLNLIYQAADKNSANIDRSMMGSVGL
jgi:hypothetical protein